MHGSDYINITAMDEAIAEYKKTKREALELKLLDMFAQIVKEYKKEIPQGGYLALFLSEDGSLSVNNAYGEEDAEHPINAIIYGSDFEGQRGQFESRPINKEEQPDE